MSGEHSSRRGVLPFRGSIVDLSPVQVPTSSWRGRVRYHIALPAPWSHVVGDDPLVMFILLSQPRQVWPKCQPKLAPFLPFKLQASCPVGNQAYVTEAFPRADIHELLSPDLLHQVIKGTFKDHIVTWIHKYLELIHGERGANEIMDEIDWRYVTDL